MRCVFSSIRDGAKDNKKPIDELKNRMGSQNLGNLRNGIQEQLKDLTKLSLETAIETLIKVSMEPRT